jgi:hypothetical protein
MISKINIKYIHQGVVCNTGSLTCKFNKPCEDVVPVADAILYFSISDTVSPWIEIELALNDMFIPGLEVGDTANTCYIGIF